MISRVINLKLSFGSLQSLSNSLVAYLQYAFILSVLTLTVGACIIRLRYKPTFFNHLTIIIVNGTRHLVSARICHWQWIQYNARYFCVGVSQCQFVVSNLGATWYKKHIFSIQSLLVTSLTVSIYSDTRSDR